MSRNEHFEQGAGSTPDTPAFVTKGNGAAVHIAVPSSWAAGGVAPKCDGWGGSGGGGRVARVRPSTAEAATCKSCLRAQERESSK